MVKRGRRPKPMATMWRVPDALGAEVAPVLAERAPPKGTGRTRIDQRAAVGAILVRLRSGCRWTQLPKEFPDDSSVHRPWPRRQQRGVVDRLWARRVEAGDEPGGVDWEGPAAAGRLGTARLGGT